MPPNTETAAVNPRVGIARWQGVSPCAELSLSFAVFCEDFPGARVCDPQQLGNSINCSLQTMLTSAYVAAARRGASFKAETRSAVPSPWRERVRVRGISTPPVFCPPISAFYFLIWHVVPWSVVPWSMFPVRSALISQLAVPALCPLQCYLSTSRISAKIFCANAASPFRISLVAALPRYAFVVSHI